MYSSYRLDDGYFSWLYSKAFSILADDPSKCYWELLRHLHSTEFIYLFGNDENRAEDGRNLRRDYIRELRIPICDDDREWLDVGCSMLELLMGISNRLEFATGRVAREWFWELLGNIDLQDYADNRELDHNAIDEILQNIIFHNYNPDGSGGLFPLKHANADQTELELWRQMNSYILERE